MYVRYRNILQNATFCSPEQVYAKDIALYKPTLTVSDIVRTFIVALLMATQKSK